MRSTKIILAIALTFGLTACSSKFRSYDGPEVTSIQVHKSTHKMYLLHNDQVLANYSVGLGFAPQGHKQFEGDGRTPEGSYFINRRNPESEYHLSLGISYPSDADRAAAQLAGKSPGGDIFIHGRSNWKGKNKGDWTAGCIAVKDREMEVVYAMVQKGTTIHILP
ncbi:MAG: L,D-transpeptidase family protein [Pseudorhodobacter sp.]|nr:L,D-transpeptidase family protein [Pseudorhodobacter sp.]